MLDQAAREVEATMCKNKGKRCIVISKSHVPLIEYEPFPLVSNTYHRNKHAK
jgi:hypothetical protein